MFVLGLESATTVASVAVASEDKILAERMVNNRRTHSVNLLPMIKDTLADAEISKEQLTGIAVSSGPGSFTGLRIGVSTARALAQVLDLPLAGVPTLEVLAYSLGGQAGLVCPILNARKNELYAALYRNNLDMQECLIPAQGISSGNLLALLSDFKERIIFTGDGLAEYGEYFKTAPGIDCQLTPVCVSFPRSGAVAELGLKLFQSGGIFDPFTLLPNYARESEAELTWRERNLRT